MNVFRTYSIRTLLIQTFIYYIHISIYIHIYLFIFFLPIYYIYKRIVTFLVMLTLRTTTFNSSIYDVKQLCDNSDIIFLQELWLFQNELHILSNIHDEFEGMGISAMDDGFALIQGRPYGGIGILVRKSLRRYINFVFYDNCRIMGVELLQNGNTYIFINTYMPFQCATTLTLSI